ncbi:uncharacterized protein EV420DRAFT_1485316 [Desarmillaria tabescens]|uniref:Uncharacterized protein n=1 Tax=Armillaria tabescens TaxID=1929756 RepID=A0AA39JHY1_ARMTA|nr:uncharacterized protein EV420DRAFT_1485316 [Desarmillaria tabescens]KAK0442497.1 hypothetical protein EV420DRAFT_1485316 [Desarmillaria tabescens]
MAFKTGSRDFWRTFRSSEALMPITGLRPNCPADITDGKRAATPKHAVTNLSGKPEDADDFHAVAACGGSCGRVFTADEEKATSTPFVIFQGHHLTLSLIDADDYFRPVDAALSLQLTTDTPAQTPSRISTPKSRYFVRVCRFYYLPFAFATGSAPVCVISRSSYNHRRTFSSISSSPRACVKTEDPGKVMDVGHTHAGDRNLNVLRIFLIVRRDLTIPVHTIWTIDRSYLAYLHTWIISDCFKTSHLHAANLP